MSTATLRTKKPARKMPANSQAGAPNRKILLIAALVVAPMLLLAFAGGSLAMVLAYRAKTNSGASSTATTLATPATPIIPAVLRDRVKVKDQLNAKKQLVTLTYEGYADQPMSVILKKPNNMGEDEIPITNVNSVTRQHKPTLVWIAPFGLPDEVGEYLITVKTEREVFYRKSFVFNKGQLIAK